MDQKFITVILKDMAKHHFMILRILQEKDRFFVTEIVKRLGITKSQMTASIDKLLQFEYIERFADAKDRRKIYIAITEKGEEVTQVIINRIKQCLQKDIEKLSSENLDKLEDALSVLVNFCSLNEEVK